MGPAEWDEVLELFHAAREMSGRDRIELLDSACGENTVFRNAVEDLLSGDESAEGFLSQPRLTLLANEPRANRIVPGQYFGRYVMEALLGRGGMGEVWSARDTDLDRSVALKFLSSEALAASEAEQIAFEAKAASALNHPNIVTIHEVMRSESSALAIVMELVEGAPLRQPSGERLPLARVLTIGSQIAEALAVAHGGGIIHADIKPENIFLRRDGYIKLLDFGLAHRITTDRLAIGRRSALGTLRYLSPEQARGEWLTPATDIFSFGLVLYELATGRHAFKKTSAIDTARAILSEEPLLARSIDSSVPVRLEKLLRAMLAKEPEGRPGAQEVADVLHKLEAPPTALPLWKWMMAAITLLAIGLGSWWWQQAREKRHPPLFRQITTLVPENRATAAAISPDGKLAAYANVDGVFVRTLATGDTKNWSAPADYVVDRLAWFADDRRLLASGFSTITYIPSVWLISGNGAPPRLLRTKAREASASFDGRQVVFVTADKSEIWVAAANGEAPRRIVSDPQDRFEFVFWSPDGRRLMYERHRHSPQKDTLNYESIAIATGKTLVTAPAYSMRSGAALADGRVVFLRWDNDNYSSSDQIWEVKTDLATGAFVGQPRKIADTTGDGRTLLDLSVTADGKQAMVLRTSDQNTIFVGRFDLSPPRISDIRRLTLDERTNNPHAWTADSRAVIFESDRNGNFDLFKQDISQRMPETLVTTPLTEILPQTIPDGRFVLYAARPPEREQPWFYKPRSYKLMCVPVNGGTPTEVPIGGLLDEFRCALGAGQRCVLRTTLPEGYRAYYDLEAISGKGRELARTRTTLEYLGDWDISPDGKHVAIPNHDPREARIRVVALQPKPNEMSEWDVVLAGVSNLRGLVWAADGGGWFVSVDTTVGNRMLYVYMNGQYRSLGDIQGWAVPSPDGKHLAFLDRTTATNAWLIDRQAATSP